MRPSGILQEDREQMIALCKRMTPHERLVAYVSHTQLITQMHQAGVRYRSRRIPSSHKNKKRNTR